MIYKVMQKMARSSKSGFAITVLPRQRIAPQSRSSSCHAAVSIVVMAEPTVGVP